MNAPVSHVPVSHKDGVPPSLAALRLATERAEDGPAVEALIDHAFGPGRLAKTAERLREGNQPLRDLSFCAFEGERLVGAVRLWPIHVGEGRAVFLGPVAVAGEWRRRGLMGELVGRACEAARAAGEPAVVLVGDLHLFASSGFEPVPEGRVTLPGPVDYRRVLWRVLDTGAAEAIAGLARPAA